MLDQVVQNGDRLAHARHQRHFLFFASFEQMLIVSLNAWVVTSGNQGRHVEHLANVRASSNGSPFAALGARIIVDRCNARQLGDLASVERA